MSNTNSSTKSFINTPLFQVGELVGLVSVDFPHLNGKYHVRVILHEGEEYLDKFLGKTVLNVGGNFKTYCYSLDEIELPNSIGHEYLWNESALRKIHKPSQYSYDQLLTELKNTDKIPSTV